jgi:hypothetical protein
MTTTEDYPNPIDGADPEDLATIEVEEEGVPQRRGAGMDMSALEHMGSVTTSCRQKATEVLTFIQTGGNHRITHIWGYDPRQSNVEHHSGLAVDFMLYNSSSPGGIDRAAGDKIAAYVIANSARLGLRWVIWRQRVFNVTYGYWRDMDDRGNPTANHMDHTHILFKDLPYRAPDGKPEPVAPEPADQPNPAKVRALQSLLELTADGKWGANTDEWALRMRAACKVHLGWPEKENWKFREDLVQRVIDVTPDNIWGPASQKALLLWLLRLQRVLGVSADGAWGPDTERSFLRLRTANLNKF